MASRSSSIYEPQLTVPTAQIPPMISGSLGGDLAAEAGGVLGALEKKMRADAVDWVTSTTAGLRKDLTKRRNEARANGEGEAFDATFEEDLARQVKALEKDMPPYARRLFEAGVENVRVDFLRPSSPAPGEPQAAAVEPPHAHAAETFEKHQETAYLDDQQWPHANAEARAYLATLPPEQRAALEGMVDDIPRRAFEGIAERDAERAAAMFKSGEVDAYISDAKARPAMRARVETEVRRRASDKAAKAGAAGAHAAFDALDAIDAAAKGHGSFIALGDPTTGKFGREQVRELRRREDEAQRQAKRRADELDAVAKRMMAGETLDADDPAQVRGGNDLYENHFVPDLEGRTAEEQRRRKLDFIVAAGLVPDKVRREIDADLRSGDVGRMAAAAAFIDELERKNPAFGKVFDSDDRRMARSIAALTEAGFEGVAAVKRHLEASDLAPDKRAQHERELQRLIAASGDMGREVGRALGQALGVPEDAELARGDDADADATMRTLEYDPERDGDAARPRTLKLPADEEPVLSRAHHSVVGQTVVASALRWPWESEPEKAIDPVVKKRNYETAQVAKELQYFSYDPKDLEKGVPGWSGPLVVFDNRLPEGLPRPLYDRNWFRQNKRGFGGYLAQRQGTNDYAFMIKGVEVSDSEGRWPDIGSAALGGGSSVGQVNEVAEDIYQQLKAKGVFLGLERGGHLMITGHSQGAPQAQLLGIYLVTRAIEDGMPEEQALRAIQVRGFGGVGGRNQVAALRYANGSPLKVRASVLEKIDAITYLLTDDPARGSEEPYVGAAWLVDTPSGVKPEEKWAQNPLLRSHPRSVYRAADYQTARPDPKQRRGSFPEDRYPRY